MSRRPWRGVDTEPGWINRRFKDLETQVKELAAAKRLPASSVAGGVVTINEILTDPNVGIAFCDTDKVVATGPGILYLQLSYVPIPGSLEVFWGGLSQPPTEWTLSGNVVTITDPGNVIRSGHTFTACYAYRAPGATPISPVLTPTGSISWASTGPALVVAEGDTTNYSATSFDDSGWPNAHAPVGHPNPLVGAPAVAGWANPNTDTGSTNVGLWLRRTITVYSAATFTINAKVDGQWWVYLDGTLIGSNPTQDSIATPGPYVQAVSRGVHVVALHVNDDTLDPGTDSVYGDLNVAVA